MLLYAGGYIAGVMTLAGGELFLNDATDFDTLTSVNYVLDTAETDARMIDITANSDHLGVGATTYSLNLNNTASGEYILIFADSLTGMNNKQFSVTNNNQLVDITVGSDFTFSNGDYLSLHINHAINIYELVADFSAAGSICSDFNANDTSDILWRNSSSGDVGMWESGEATNWSGFGSAPVATWSIVGVGDFNGDGHADILWHGSDGTVGSWTSGDANEWQGRGSVPIASWEVVGIGDFDGNGNSDILWQNKANGLVGTWESGDGANWQARGTVPRASWEVVGVGDFSNDGQADILWQNRDNGMIGVWNDGDGNQWQQLGIVSRDAWEVSGVGDFDADGADDILWQHKTTGLVGAWNGGDANDWQQLGAAPRANWEIAGVGDFNGNDHADILWRSKTSTTVGMWESGDSNNWQQLGNASADWQVQIA